MSAILPISRGARIRKLIAANQALQFMMADMTIQNRGARNPVYRAAYLKDYPIES